MKWLFPQRRPSTASAYLVAVLAVVVALFLRFSLVPLVEARRPFITLFGAIAFAVWYGRWKPAVLAAVIGFVGANFFIIEPVESIHLDGLLLFDAIGYGLSAGMIIVIGEGMHRAHQRYRHEAEERNRTAQTLRVTFESIGDGLLTTDADARVTFLNPIAEQLTGWNLSDAVGQPLETVFEILNEQTRETVENPVRKALREGLIVGLANHTVLIRKDRSELPIDDSAAPIRDPSGQVLGCVLVFRDVTRRRQAERQKQSLMTALEEADRRKNQFLATLAHELRNPLAPIRNAIQVLVAQDPRDPELKWCQEVIDRQVHHMSRLLDDLFDVSRITHDKLELRKSRIDLATVIQGAVETSRPHLDQDGKELAVLLPAEPVYLDADVVRLTQVFANLLNNAAKFTNARGHVRVKCERQGSDVVIAVSDDGEGIAPEALPHIFETFSRGGHPLDRHQEGLGIGLSLVRGLVELHGGTVEARSDGRGKGSEFIVRLPVMPGAQTPVSLPATKEEPAAKRRRLLIADDLKDSADSLALLLRMKGHEVTTAYDGEAALLVAQEFKPDVILLDIGMPKRNGYDACRQLRREPWTKGMYIVALTGWGQEEDRQRARAAGFDHHIVKPVDPEELNRLLGTLS